MVMKKLMFALALVSLVFTSAQAQKQLGGEHNVEVNLTPFGDSPIDGSTLKYRNFLDDDKALRVRLTLGVNNTSYAYSQFDEITTILDIENVDSPQLDLATSSSVIGIGVGYEIHFGGTDNLSPYFGFEGNFSMASVKHTKEMWGPNEAPHIGLYDKFVEWEYSNSQSVTNYGLGLLFGADYYFNDAIYIGLETGIGFGITSVGNHEISTQLVNGGVSLSAFNIEFGNPSDENYLAIDIADSFVGQLPFDAVTDFMYDEYIDEDTDTVLNASPNRTGNFMFGNVFNAALRFGYLFD
jgi:opacity protein-like surface antigen